MNTTPGMSEEMKPCRACGGDKGHWEGCRGEATLLLELEQEREGSRGNLLRIVELEMTVKERGELFQEAQNKALLALESSRQEIERLKEKVAFYENGRQINEIYIDESEMLGLEQELEAERQSTRELITAASEIEDILEVPRLLGASSQLIIEKAIDRFKTILARHKAGGKAT